MNMRVQVLVSLVIWCSSVSPGFSHAKDDGYMGSRDGKAQNKLKDSRTVHDKEHLKEHLDETAKIDVDKMSEREVSFHYFKVHDLNMDNRLDGLELMTAFLHGYEQKEDPKGTEEELRQNREAREEMAIATLDLTLAEFDTNDDGYIDYVEFGNSIDKHLDERNNPT